MSSAQAELLQTVLESEPYPWLPSGQASEKAGDADPLEAAGQALEMSDEEAAVGWQGLSAQLNQMWGASQTASQTAGQKASEAVSLSAVLQEKFANRLPSAMIALIGEKAQQFARSGEPMVAQMIGCVKDGLANIAEADLQVMARPMAMAMRGNSSDEFVEATIQSIRVAEWETLSPIEQAKLSLAAARYAIAQTEESA